MICQRCNKDVDTLYGNGKYPNKSYKCSKCYDDETGIIVKYAVVFFVILIVITYIICSL